VRAPETLGDVRGAVGRSIVDDDELPLAARERLREAFDERWERAGFVVGGDDDRGERGRSLRARPCVAA
jgi:hypothetical protein